MFNHYSSANSNSSNSNQLPPPSSYSGIPQQQQSNNFGQQSSMSTNSFAQNQQQWIMRATMAAGQNNNIGQQIPHFLTNVENNFGKMPTNSNALKRQMDNPQEEEKENLEIKRTRPCLDLDPPIPDGPEENKNCNLVDEEEADDEEEEEENSRSTKTDSSSCSENLPVEQKTSNGNENMPQFGNIPPKGIYSITPNQQNMAQIGHNNQFGMNFSAPLAHSTPILPGNFYANSNAIQNLQQIYAGNFHQLGGGHYAGQLNPSIGAGPSTPSLANLANARQNGQQSIQPHQPIHQQLFGGVYGGYSPSGNMLAAYAQQQRQIHQQQLITPPSFNSIASYKIGNDSGVGGENRGGQKNESSSTGGGSSEESSTGAPNLASIKEEANEEPKFKFPPYVRIIKKNDQRQWADLEEIIFDKPVPSRLSLLNINQKYQVSLAEIHRRLQPPECLNTSYLSGVLRRAKKADGGKILRKELAEYECGLDLQSGKRKMSQVTTFTTLCEREALQMAKDFEKITNDSQNGFPHQQIAMEMSRRASAIQTTPEQKKQRMEELRSTMEILAEAISIVQNAIGMETQQFASSAELMAQPMQNNQLMPQTLDQFKRFARLSHCFGNRSIVVCWESLLKVFGHYERLQGEFLPLDFSAASTSNSNSASFLAKQEGGQ